MLWPEGGLGNSGLTGKAESKKKHVDSARPSKGSDAWTPGRLHSYPASHTTLFMQMVSWDTRLMPQQLNYISIFLFL